MNSTDSPEMRSPSSRHAPPKLDILAAVVRVFPFRKVEMSDEVKLHKNESIKEHSRQLRGTLAEELRSGADGFSADMEQ